MYEPIDHNQYHDIRARLAATLTATFLNRYRDANETPDFHKLLDLGYSPTALTCVLMRMDRNPEDRISPDALSAFGIELTQAISEEAELWLAEHAPR